MRFPCWGALVCSTVFDPLRCWLVLVGSLGLKQGEGPLLPPPQGSSWAVLMVTSEVDLGPTGFSVAGEGCFGSHMVTVRAAPPLRNCGLGRGRWDSLWRIEALWHFLAGTFFCHWLLHCGEWRPAIGVCTGWRRSLSLLGAVPARFRAVSSALLHGDKDAVGALLRSIYGLCFEWAREDEKCDISMFRSGIQEALDARRPGYAIPNLIECLGGLVMALDGHRRRSCPTAPRLRPVAGGNSVPLPLPVEGSLRLGWPSGGGRVVDIFDVFYSSCRRRRFPQDCCCEWCLEGCALHLPWFSNPHSECLPPLDCGAPDVAAALGQLSLDDCTEVSIMGAV